MRRSERNKLLRQQKVDNSLIRLLKVLRRLGLFSEPIRKSNGWADYIARHGKVDK